MLEDKLTQILLSLEASLFQESIRHSAVDLERLLDKDFIEIGSSGILYDRESIIAALLAESRHDISMFNFRLQWRCSDMALVTYRAEIRNRASGQISVTMRSSLWRLMGDRWKMVFHQGTLVS
jgi:glyoxylase I family protein